MRQTHCLHCGLSFKNVKSSKEHIFPQSIGGNIWIEYLLCKSCNNDLGRRFDSNLAECFKLLSVLFQVYREKKNPLPGYRIDLRDSELPVYVTSDGSIKLQEGLFTISDGSKVLIADSQESYERALSKLRIKNPNLKEEKQDRVSNSISAIQMQNAKICLSSGNKIVSLAILKIAWTSFIYLGGDTDYVKHIPKSFDTNYDSDFVSPIGISYLTNKANEDESVYHRVKIICSSEVKAIYAVVELFETFQYSVLLNSRYLGEHKEFELSQNAITGKRDFSPLKFHLEELLEFLKTPRSQQEEKILERWKPLYTLLNKKFTVNGLEKTLSENPFGIPPDSILTVELTESLVPQNIRMERREF